MRRKSFGALVGVAGLVLAVTLGIAGGLLTWGSAYIHNAVHNQLAAQQIYFPAASAFAHAKAGTEITPGMIPSVSQYAGQQMLTGQQAEAFADHFIAVHIAEMGAGKTYATVATVFKGETLRSMLLNAYGWWKASQIMWIAAIITFILGGLSLIGSGIGFWLRRTSHEQHTAPPLTPPVPAAVA